MLGSGIETTIGAKDGSAERLLLARSTPPFPSHLWELDPPIPGDPERIEAWVEALVGGELDTETGIVRRFDDQAGRLAKERLKRLGGSPPP